MKYFVIMISILSALTFLTSCTYNVTMAHTSGGSTETIEDTASNTPNIAPTVTIPVTPGSNLGISK